MTSKIQILGQNLALWEGHFDNFQGQESRFLDLFKALLELFRSRIGIFLALKEQCLRVSSAQNSTLQYLLWGPADALPREKPEVLIVWVVVGLGAYLPFGSLDHARAIFFKFLVLKGVWHGGGTILKSV